MGYIGLTILGVFAMLLIISNVRVVPQAQSYVIERLGAYAGTWTVGIHVKIPLMDKIANKVSLKENVIDFPPQPAITKDNVTIKIDTIIYYQVTDAKLFTYGVARPVVAMEMLTATTLRNIVGHIELDETLTSRDLINTQMRAILDEATDPWGIKVNRVEVKNIIPPADIQEAMEKQMRAERERRESILRAEGEKQSAILVAEGHKASVILSAEADKQSVILAAEARKEANIREAEGQAQAIRTVQEATAQGITMVKEAGADHAVLTLKSFEALVKVADGQSTKLIIPSELQGLAGTFAALAETVRMDTKEKK